MVFCTDILLSYTLVSLNVSLSTDNFSLWYNNLQEVHVYRYHKYTLEKLLKDQLFIKTLKEIRVSLTSRGSLGISSIMGISSPFSARFASIAYRNSNFTGRSPISKSSSDWWILLWLSWQSSGDIPAYKIKSAFQFEKSVSCSFLQFDSSRKCKA